MCIATRHVRFAPESGHRERPITGLTFDVKPADPARMFVSLSRNPLEAGDADSHVCKSKSLKAFDLSFSAGVANKSRAYALAGPCSVLQHATTIPLTFQRLPIAPRNSMQHACNMERRYMHGVGSLKRVWVPDPPDPRPPRVAFIGPSLSPGLGPFLYEYF